MMEAAENRDLNHSITRRRRVSSRLWYTLVDPLMGAGVIVIAAVLGEDRQHLPLGHDEMMVEAFSAYAVQ